MGLTRLTAPAVEPVTLAEAKAHLRVEHSADDTLISALIVAAREAAESRTGRALITQTWRSTHAEWPDDIALPRPPLVSVQTVTYLDADGVRQTLAGSSYLVITDSLVGNILPAYGASWPTARAEPGSIRIDYTAGYGNAAAVPQALKVWMLLVIGTWYSQREAIVTGTIVNEIPRGFWEGLLDPYLIHQL
jgi:uncharacterized phiE125 gp8 family phage protein